MAHQECYEYYNIRKVWNKYSHTREIRKTKKNRAELQRTLKKDSKTFFAYVRSKQCTKNIFGPLTDDSREIIESEQATAAYLKNYFSSVFTKEVEGHLPISST
jgi:SMC interacting uncharacterized protein involved in chromosome segregation